MLQLPPELLSEVLTYVLDIHNRPADVLCVHSRLHILGSHVIYSRLHFSSVQQLLRFSQGCKPLPCVPQSIRVALPGGRIDLDVFRYLRHALLRCAQNAHSSAQHLPRLPLELQLLFLRLNSHSSNPNLGDIYDALVLAK
ncbi:uncharacterized protein PHACADRAFT_254007 [Phanerochaete carnosa HHB-10118-sp]|uniref:F-box domain-containing protein n=1 Tax=Phanerochaete carnosa (strain HHB-10118-sp) TaxID=650164 RepID=K5V2G7_PHACS|nr:uncharacterized protein PHACADRAFT_254007 [Phanerochaete carnosa HHB-10118-sp]EKM56721.1 hypothetical protein PHACADRAFT_254007 [Phanerochaete carnosa HHB-10118-sp]